MSAQTPAATRDLKSISSFITKGATPTTYGFQWETSGVTFLRSECVSPHGLDMKRAMFISPEADAALQRSRVRNGDILMTITGNVGRVVQLAGPGTANINQHIARIRVTDKDFDPRYVYHFLSQPGVRAFFESITTGQAYPQLSLKQVRATVIPALPLPEQHGIAQALADADHLIDSLGRRIGKARAIKVGTMQELLTGRTRLPGFNEDWFEFEFADFLATVNTRGSQVDAHDYELFGPAPVVDQSRNFIAGYTSKVLPLLQPGRDGLIVFGDHTCITKFVDFPFVVGADGTKAIRSRRPEHVMARFIAYLLELSPVEQTGYNRHFSKLRERSFVVPEKSEQAAIIAVLVSADGEIAALERRLESIRAIKEGMMQRLLTGHAHLSLETDTV